MAKKSSPKSGTSPKQAHRDLKNMDIRVNELGEIVRDYNVDDINAFLNEKVKDKKLEDK